MVTKEEIDELEKQLNDKFREISLQRDKIRREIDRLERIKFRARRIEKSPAKQAVIENGRIIEPARPAEMETIYDKMPEDADLPSKSMASDRQDAIYNDIKGSLAKFGIQSV